MFTKKDLPASDAVDAPAKPQRTAMKAKAPSIISNDLKISGSITSEGEIQLDGQVDGDIRAGSLTVGEEAAVNGEVYAENVVVRGRVNGSIRARQVQLAATARIEGDIVHATLAIESGAYFDGYCKRSNDPLADNKSGSGASSGGASTGSSSGSTQTPSKPSPPSASAAASASPAAASSGSGAADILGAKS
jgi:cytoskeletal protein CcmA (bactofilin family)